MDTISSVHMEACLSTSPRPLNHVRHHGRLEPTALQGNERITVSLSRSLVERLRNAVYWTERRTMAGVITEAIEDALAEMEEKNGDVFPARLRQLRPGRRRQPQAFAQNSSTVPLPDPRL